jgi:FAD:protein FMN transferase
VSLWRKARRVRQLPDPERLAEARKAVGYKKLKLDPKGHRVNLLTPGMKLDLGAIAKGYAVDEALKELRRCGIKWALVAGSGDIGVSDPPPAKNGWRIELAPLDVSNAPPRRFLLLANRALATSGDVFQRLEIDGKRYSHIVDPRTGLGLTDHSLVTVVANDCTTADSLATAISVLGPTAGLKLAKQYPATAVHLVRKPGTKIETLETPGFKDFYEPEN